MKGKKLLLVLASSVLVLAGCGNQGGKSGGNGGNSGGNSGSSELPPVAEPATGAFSYANSSNADRTEILGVLEKWAVDKKLTGITLYEDGGYVMYSPLVEKGAPNYIKGYGYGTLAEGRLTGPLTGEEETKYQMYYHTYQSSDPAKILYMDDDGGVVSSLVGYVSGGYYDIVMNATRTGYKWVGDLARNDEPIAINPAADGSSKVYRIPVKTGAALKYSTLSADPRFAAFNNREVALDDYLTPYKVYYTAAYNMRRNSEIKDANSGSIAGGSAYVAASATGFNQAAWDELGIKVGTDDAADGIGDYIEFTFNAAYTPFWARYYLSSSMFAPVPEDFLKALGNDDLAAGIALWGKFNDTATLSPVDTFLSTGPYVLEEWVNKSKIVYKRNPNYVSGEDRKTTRPSSYNIVGVYVDVITALSSDREAALKKFLDNKLHAVTIPSTQLETYVDDPRTTLVPGSTTTKLNLNTCNKEQWEELFGENGSITQTPKTSYWKLKPAMQNSNFVDGLSYCIDRKTFANKLGATPSNDYFGSGYYSDPENGIFYNDTDAHKNAVAASLEGTDGYGYSLEKAKVAFKAAAQELIENGDYEVGDKIELEMAWMLSSQEDTYAKPLAKMIEDAFNAADTGLTLEISHYYGAVYTDVYYKKMMVGQFDIGYGGIEGNSYNPLNFMEVLKSDNSSTFTLNWGIPTNEYVELEWDGKLWTYDALWEVADHGGYVEGGKNVVTFDVKDAAATRLADGGLEVNFKLLTKDVENFKTEMDSFCLFACTDSGYADYFELYAYADGTSAGIDSKKTQDYIDQIIGYFGEIKTTWVYGTEKDADGYIDVKVTLPAVFMQAFYAFTGFSDASEFYVLGFDAYRSVTFFGEKGAPSFAGTFLELEAMPAIPAE